MLIKLLHGQAWLGLARVAANEVSKLIRSHSNERGSTWLLGNLAVYYINSSPFECEYLIEINPEAREMCAGTKSFAF